MEEKRKEIKELIAKKPGAEIAPGLYVKKVGRKWVSLLDTRDTQTTTERVSIEEFYAQQRK